MSTITQTYWILRHPNLGFVQRYSGAKPEWTPAKFMAQRFATMNDALEMSRRIAGYILTIEQVTLTRSEDWV